MYDFEDYYEPSEYEELIEETIDKIRNSILSRAKEDIEYRTHEVERLKEELEKEKRIRKKVQDGNKEKDKQIEDLKNKLEKKLTAYPHTEHNIGDEVWVLNHYRTETLYCEHCNGKGTIIGNDEKYGEVEFKCPYCLGSSYKRYADKSQKNLMKVEYTSYGVLRGCIDEIDISIDCHNEVDVDYYVKIYDVVKKYSSKEVFSNVEDAANYKDMRNNEEQAKAFKKYHLEDE